MCEAFNADTLQLLITLVFFGWVAWLLTKMS
jgi:flagellar biogenesis protein FliO